MLYLDYLSCAGDPNLPDRFQAAVDRACQLLADQPRLGKRLFLQSPALAEARMWVLREFPQYLLVYEPRPNGIRLLRVMHAKLDIWRVLK